MISGEKITIRHGCKSPAEALGISDEQRDKIIKEVVAFVQSKGSIPEPSKMLEFIWSNRKFSINERIMLTLSEGARTLDKGDLGITVIKL